MTRLFRNPNIKVGDKVRIHDEPVQQQPIDLLNIEPSPEEVGSVVVVTAIITYNDTSLDYDVDYEFPGGSHGVCDSQYLEIV